MSLKIVKQFSLAWFGCFIDAGNKQINLEKTLSLSNLRMEESGFFI